MDGQEIKIPFNGIEEMFKQLIPQQLPEPRKIVSPVPIQRSQQIIRRIMECRDTEVRNVVIEMNQRLNKLEELLKLKDQTPAKKIISKTKVNTKPIKLLMTKGKSKEKPKVKIKSPAKTKSIPKKNDKKGSKKKVSTKSKR